MADVMYNAFKKYLLNSAISLLTDTIHAILLTASYTPDIDAHAFRGDLTNEISGTGYTAGGQTIATKTVTQDNTNDCAVFDSDDPQWTTASFTARQLALAKWRGGLASADELIGCWDFGSNVTSTAANFTVVINVGGWFKLG